MKFYEKIIGINKDALGSPELKITFSENGFEFDNNLYLNQEKILSLDGHYGEAIRFRNSKTAISDLDDYVLHFGGNSKGILFDFASGTISATNWNLGNSGGIYGPLNNIYATNGYFDKLLPLDTSNKVIGASNNRWENIYTKRIDSTAMSTVTMNVANLIISPPDSSPLVLPNSSKIDFRTGSMRLGGADINRIDITTPYIKRSSDGKTWNDTDQQVKWRCVETRVNAIGCLQFFTKIDDAAITNNHNSLLIPSPVTSNLIADNDYLQLSYGATTSQYAPTIEPFEDQGKQYFLVERAYNLTYLYIQLTRFIFNV